MNKLNNYFMKPTVMENGLYIYPINIMVYEEFKELATQYIVLDIKSINNKRSQERERKLEFDHLFDYLINFIETNNEIDEILKQIDLVKSLAKEDINLLIEKDSNVKYILDNEPLLKELSTQSHRSNILKLIGMTIKDTVEFNDTFKCFDIRDKEGELIAVISKDNFYEYREIVMAQNILFEPLIAPTKQAQRFIDNKLKGFSGDGDSSDLEAIVAFVCTNTPALDVSNYTYYRLMADFYSLLRQLNRREVVSYSAAGATKKNGKPLDVPSVISELEVSSNPYDGIFTEVKEEN